MKLPAIGIVSLLLFALSFTSCKKCVECTLEQHCITCESTFTSYELCGEAYELSFLRDECDWLYDGVVTDQYKSDVYTDEFCATSGLALKSFETSMEIGGYDCKRKRR